MAEGGLPLFWGKQSEDPLTWYKLFTAYLWTKKTPKDQAKFGYMANCMRGAALSWYQGLALEGEGALDYDGVRTAFMQRFRREENCKWRDVAQLWRTSQTENQSVEDYIQDMEAQGQKAHLPEETVKLAILNGFKSNIRNMCLQHEINDMTALRRWSLVAEQCDSTKSAPSSDLDSVLERMERLLNAKEKQGTANILPHEYENSSQYYAPIRNNYY